MYEVMVRVGVAVMDCLFDAGAEVSQEHAARACDCTPDDEVTCVSRWLDDLGEVGFTLAWGWWGASFDAPEHWRCSWLVDVGYSPDGDPLVRECGALTVVVGGGYECRAGHAHRGIEAELGAYGLEWQREQADRGGW